MFENQWELPPISGENIPYISFDNYKEDLDYIYNEVLNNKVEYDKMLDTCKVVAEKYSDENFMEEWTRFIERF
jgi:hypothetical protein